MRIKDIIKRLKEQENEGKNCPDEAYGALLNGQSQGYNSCLNTEIEVDEEILMDITSGKIGICKEQVVRQDEKIMITFEVEKNAVKCISKTIAKAIEQGKVLKVKI